MSFRTLILALIFGLFLSNAFSQESYWQQDVTYDIDVKFDDYLNTLDGKIKIRYTNNSPDELKKIVFHLWPNAYKNNSTAFAHENKFFATAKYGRGWIDSLDFKVGGESVKLVYDSVHIDIATIQLNKALKPGQTIVITTPFHVQIPYAWSRFGTAKDRYSMTQWYPKPAVYDKNGWHPMPYKDQGEFYAEFGSFNVKITLRKDFVVAATGNLKTQSEITWLKEREEESKVALENGFPITTATADSLKWKTLRYTEKNVTDFAWFTCKDYYVMSDTATMPSGRTVNTYLFFSEREKQYWKKAMPYLKETVTAFSNWVGEYPYDNITAVDGPLLAGGGMEYPTITVIGDAVNDEALREVICHEVGHNWFQGILGSNERDFPWMDEGINSFYEDRYMEDFHKKNGTHGQVHYFGSNFNQFFKVNHFCVQEAAYKYQSNRKADQAIGLHSDSLTSNNYGMMVYMKSVLVFRHLQDYLGKEDFDRLMQLYFEKWKFKHPQPEDLEAIFTTTHKYLGWAFNDFINTTRVADYELVKIEHATDTIGHRIYDRIHVRNNGKVRAPFTISAVKNDSVIYTQWFDGFRGIMPVMFYRTDYDYYIIDAEHRLLDENRNNNRIKKKGMLKKVEPLRLQFGLSLENGERTEITYLPLMLWNSYDQTMLGMSFYNGFLYERQWEYGITPLYGFGSQELVGSARLSWNQRYRTGMLKKLTIGGSVTRFNYDEFNDALYSYNKMNQFFQFQFRTQKADKHSILEVKSTLLGRYYFNHGAINEGSVYHSDSVVEVKFTRQNVDVLHPRSLEVVSRTSTHYSRLSGEFNARLPYLESRKGLNIRLFGGVMLTEWGGRRQNPMNNHGFKAGGFNVDDNLMEELYLSRGEDRFSRPSILGNQVYMNDGGFKVNTSLGNTTQWIVASNFEARLPIKLPVELFFDIATTGDLINSPVGDQFIYDFGLAVPAGPFKLYLPLAMSKSIQSSLERSYVSKVSFKLDLTGVNPYKIRDLYFDL